MTATILAYIVRMFELPLLLALNKTSFETLDVYFNAVYATFLTITTVGYGSTATIAASKTNTVKAKILSVSFARDLVI